MPYKSFEDLELYKASREFRKIIYSLIKQLPDEEKYNLASQMRRAATSFCQITSLRVMGTSLSGKHSVLSASSRIIGRTDR